MNFFPPNGRYLFEYYSSRPVFPIPQGTLPWQQILGKIGQLPSFGILAIPKRIEISQNR